MGKAPYVSTGEFAQRHGVEPQTVAIWARDGLIKGCIQVGGRWLVPTDADRPKDKRRAD